MEYPVSKDTSTTHVLPLRLNITEDAVEKPWEPEAWEEVCGEIVSSRKDREATYRNPRQHVCLNKTQTAISPRDTLLCKGDSHVVSPLKATEDLLRKEKLVFLKDEPLIG